MRHFTADAVGKDVVDRKGEPLGRITGVDDGEAVIAPETGVEARMDDVFAVRGGDDERLFVTPEMVEETTDEWVRVHVPE